MHRGPSFTPPPGAPRAAAVATFLACGLLAAGGCVQAQEGTADTPEPIVGGPCEGCEAVFQGLPVELSWSTRIAPEDEPGEPMRIEGTVTDGAGEAAAGVIVYAYHTDARGIYPRPESPAGRAAARHGRLRAWALTDARGRYRFDTIRPASYPNQTIPAHVHMHVIEPGCCTYWIDDIEFLDDPLLPETARRNEERARGGSGLVTPERDDDGTWRMTRDVVLGQNVPDRPAGG
jgi:protocatechuate 3,4-dioxygenase beta subunit